MTWLPLYLSYLATHDLAKVNYWKSQRWTHLMIIRMWTTVIQSLKCNNLITDLAGTRDPNWFYNFTNVDTNCYLVRCHNWKHIVVYFHFISILGKYALWSSQTDNTWLTLTNNEIKHEQGCSRYVSNVFNVWHWRKQQSYC